MKKPVISVSEYGDKSGKIRVSFDLEVHLGDEDDFDEGHEFSIEDVWDAVDNMCESSLGSEVLEHMKEGDVICVEDED